MARKSYAVTEIVGTSTQSIDDAIRNAIRTAEKSLNYLGWFEVVNSYGTFGEDNSILYHVVIKLGFRFDKSWSETKTAPPARERR